MPPAVSAGEDAPDGFEPVVPSFHTRSGTDPGAIPAAPPAGVGK